MKESFKQILLAGGTVSFPYKRSMVDWVGTATIYTSYVFPKEPPFHRVQWADNYKKFNGIDDAIDFYIKTVFTKKNLALALDGIRKHKMSTEDFDDTGDKKLKALMDEYFEKYFKEDYPFC